MSAGDRPGEFASGDPDFDLALRRLLDGKVAAEAEGPWEALPPAVAVLRARDMTEPLIGKRCRYLLTDHDARGNIVDYGWRSDLRIASEQEEVARDPEPCCWIQEEADYYRALNGARDAPREGARASRLWVEMYVDQPRPEGRLVGPSHGASAHERSVRENPNAWLARVVQDPNIPRVVKPIPAREAHSFVGRRAIILDADGDYEADLRVVDEPTFTSEGDIGVTVVAEGSWYRWKEPQVAQDCRLRTYPVEQVWIEA